MVMFGLDAPYPEEVKAFGENWCGPESYENQDWHIVAKYPKYEGGDGQSVDVFCAAMPARFYKLCVKSEPDSVGTHQPAVELKTGSSQWKLAADIAKAFAEGMLTLNT